jgi:hypothetical protein
MDCCSVDQPFSTISRPTANDNHAYIDFVREGAHKFRAQATYLYSPSIDATAAASYRLPVDAT